MIFKALSLGYLLGFFSQAFLHSISILMDLSADQSLISSARSFFGFEIYQAYVSYSAVFSLIACALIATAFFIGKWSTLAPYILFSSPIFLIVISAGRKAALLDLFLLTIVNLFVVFRGINFTHPEKLKRVLFYVSRIVYNCDCYCYFLFFLF